LWKVKQDSTVIDTPTYDDGGRMLTSTYDNGVTEIRTYNTDNTLAEIDFGGTGSAIGDLTYGWDANKNKTSETIACVMSGYSFTVPTSGYDDEDRLVDFDGAADQVDQSWNLSLVGDWDSVTTDSTTQNRTHGPTHELLTAGGSSVSTDVKGNMTSIPANLRDSSDPLALNWDFDNRMKSADTDNDSTADVFYEFDALGRRVARDDGTQDTIFVQVGQQTIADYVSGTAAASPETNYAWGSYIDELIVRRQGSNNARIYYHQNQQYSTYAVTNTSGGVLERYAYSPYGELTITNGSGTVKTSSNRNTRYTYTGREWDDDLGLYHFRARLYDPVSGRFSSRDPIGYVTLVNALYHFIDNGPIAKSDPTGLLEGPIPVIIGGELVTCGATGSAATAAATGGVTLTAGTGAACGVTFLAGVGVGYCVSYYPSRLCKTATCDFYLWWKNPPVPVDSNGKKAKWRCRTKARNWDVNSPCYGAKFEGFGQTWQEADDDAFRRCVSAGCHQPGRGGDCGHGGVGSCVRL
jgi:RHS repeat-associated protein